MQIDQKTRLDHDISLSENVAELNQAKVRLWVVAACVAYVVFRWSIIKSPIPITAEYAFEFLPIETETAIHWLILCCLFASFGLVLFYDIRRRPGHYFWRRLMAMVGEYITYTYALIVGEHIMMPFFALILATAVSNGMRFGRRYLVIAAILCQISFVAMIVFSPFWRTNVSVLLAFSITAIAVPAYAYALLRQTADARDAAFAATQAKSRFLAQASHDLRQPVHAIGYYLDILREEGKRTERNRLIDRIERALGSVAGLFKSLLDIAQLDGGKVDVKAEPTALQPLLLDLIKQNEAVAAWNDVELRFVPTALNVRADPTLLANMVQNLLSNAIKYARGSRVLVGVRRRGATVAIEVHDQGIGIDAEHLPHIFEEFYRAHVAGDHDAEGVGLGLSIVNRLAQLSGFELTLSSTRGVGTIARLSGLPISAGAVEPSLRSKADALKPLSGFSLILIEDDRDVLQATAQLLERWGCAVQAFEALPTSVAPADLIIADFDLGDGVLGTEVIAAVRTSLGATVPAILMTGHAETFVRDQIADGNIQILSKPVQPATLRSTLSAVRIAARNQA